MRDRIRRTLSLLLRVPSITLAALIYSTAIHVSSTRADLLDIANPWWILTVAILLLSSPVYHAFVIHRTYTAATGQREKSSTVPLDSFGALVAGELLANAAVTVGSVFFLLPGVYVGLRLIYYKQSIVLHKARLLPAIRESLLMTADSRKLLGMFAFLAVSYCLPLAIDFFLLPTIDSLWAHGAAVLVSTLFVSWINVFVTLSFADAERAMAEAPVPLAPG